MIMAYGIRFHQLLSKFSFCRKRAVFALGQATQNADSPTSVQLFRRASTWPGVLTDLKTDEEKGFATLLMKNPGSNALSTPFMQELSDAITTVENSTCRGLIISSNVQNIFCSGLNLAEFGGPESTEESIVTYYSGFQDFWFKLFKSPLITIAAMNGHAIAGGCAIGMACDYRILATPNFGIGMNEVHFGVAVPYYLMDVMILIMGWHNASKAGMTGKIFSADEAVKVGLVDELSSLADISAAAEKQMRIYLKPNKLAQIATKLDAKQEMIDKFFAIKAKDLERVVATINHPQTKKVLYAYIKSIKEKK